MPSINDKKYQAVILYLAQKLGGEIRGKKKLAKLLYFVDFDFFEKHNRSVTGDQYRALPMGPVPQHMMDVVSELVQAGELTTTAIEEVPGYNPTEIYSVGVHSEDTTLDTEEKVIIDRVIKKYGHLNGRQLEVLSHAEAPYIGTEPGKEIPYELTFYRGTEFGDDN